MLCLRVPVIPGCFPPPASGRDMTVPPGVVWGLPHSSSGHHRSPGEQASSCAKAFSVFSHLGIGTKLAVVGEEGEHGGSRDWRGSFS